MTALRALTFLLATAIPGQLSAQSQPAPPLETMQHAAATGDPAAQFSLGLRYHAGDGVLQNYATAAALFLDAANQSHAGAQNFLGRYHHSGLGVARDQTQALAWLRRAAAQGDPQHIYDLGSALENGADGSQNPGEAAVEYARAADLGHHDAAVSLGVLYQNGIGVPQDFKRAFALYTAPAEAGHARALNNLGLMYVRGEGVAQDYDTAARLFKSAAEQGLQTAMTNLGVMYENGFGIDQSDDLAVEWYRRAGQLKQPETDVAPAYVFDPRIVLPDPDTATLAATAGAAQGGDPLAQFLYGYALVTSDQPDHTAHAAAARMFDNAARRGLPAAMANLGILYFEGRGLPQDYVLGYQWLTLAAAAGHSQAKGLMQIYSPKLTSAQLNDANLRAGEIALTLSHAQH